MSFILFLFLLKTKTVSLSQHVADGSVATTCQQSFEPTFWCSSSSSGSLRQQRRRRRLQPWQTAGWAGRAGRRKLHEQPKINRSDRSDRKLCCQPSQPASQPSLDAACVAFAAGVDVAADVAACWADF